MDTRDGRIYSDEMVAAMAEADRRYVRPMEVDPTPEQLAAGKVGRNDPCPCGSGNKFKKCCLWRATNGTAEEAEARWRLEREVLELKGRIAEAARPSSDADLRRLEDEVAGLRRRIAEAG